MSNRIRYMAMANAMLAANFMAILTSLMIVFIFYLHSMSRIRIAESVPLDSHALFSVSFQCCSHLRPIRQDYYRYTF